MADRDILERIDQHLAHSNEHMARGNEHMARGEKLMARVTELIEDNRRFTRDLLRRNEIFMDGIMREMREFRTEMAAGRQVLIDVHEDSVAQRQGFLALIDELREHGLGGRN